MNPKLISAGGGLFALGALVGWAVTADRWERRLKEKEESQAIRIDVLRQRLRESEAAVQNFDFHQGLNLENGESDSENSPEAVMDETEVISDADAPSDEDLEEARGRLQEIIDEYTHNPEASSEVVQRAEIMDLNTPPFVISHNSFSYDEEGEDYAKITLTYFPRHRMLLDDEEDPIDDVANYVGWGNLKRFGDESNDADVVFIRNHRLQTDFEVVRDEENDLPLHVKYGMPKEEFNVGRAAGVIKIRPEDLDSG